MEQRWMCAALYSAWLAVQQKSPRSAWFTHIGAVLPYIFQGAGGSRRGPGAIQPEVGSFS